MRRPERPASTLWLALLLVGSGLALWVGATWRNPNALSMLPGADGCLTAGIVGILLALLHGVPYRTAVFLLAVPIAMVQLLATHLIGVPFYAALGLEMTVIGMFGLALSRAFAAPRTEPHAERDPSQQSARPAPQLLHPGT